MKYFLAILFLFSAAKVCAQTEPATPVQQEQLEELSERQKDDVKDDSYWQELDERQKHPINLNTVKEDELRSLQILNDLQIYNFLKYRKLMGSFINIYELQAIPTWDLQSIKLLLPYVLVKDNSSVKEDLIKRSHGGDNELLVRYSQQIERSVGFEKPADSSSYYLGSPQKIFFRYKYTYKNLLQYGLLGDKDAGEQFFKGYQKYGFDFYSFHFFARDLGIIRSLALGDFTVNMGQGLIQWQSIAFTKSAEVLSIKRQADVLRPYNSAGEFYFHRGAGITLEKGKWQTTIFGSIRKISANFDSDTLTKEDIISSFETSGYHRTKSENEDRNNVMQSAFGGNLKFSDQNFRLGINVINYHFSNSIQKQNKTYNLFAITGNNWTNASTDYSYTYRNFHLFGEFAIDKNLAKATVDGLLMSINSNVDVSVLYRNISKNYQALYGDAFTENSNPNNEKGLYTGISLRPLTNWRADAFFDLYKFPWLKYQVDAPSSGRDYFVQFTYSPNKVFNIYTRFQNQSKQQNSSSPNSMTNQLSFITQQNWRTEWQYNINKRIIIRNRVEVIWYDKRNPDHSQGFLTYVDFFYKPAQKPFSGNVRFQYFETGDYNSRVYVYENDVPYSFSIPFYYNKGVRYYLNLRCNLKKLFNTGKASKLNIEAWLRWAQSIYNGVNSIGSGLDEVHGNKKSEVKLQLLIGG
jgi:hypothetical protein